MSSMTGPDEPLEPGFVFACDVNIPHTETMGIRIEDTIVITEGGYENLSPGLPRTVEEIGRPRALQTPQCPGPPLHHAARRVGDGTAAAFDRRGGGRSMYRLPVADPRFIVT